jgi:hypothetical protein
VVPVEAFFNLDQDAKLQSGGLGGFTHQSNNGRVGGTA